jgi:hypothetical protein
MVKVRWSEQTCQENQLDRQLILCVTCQCCKSLYPNVESVLLLVEEHVWWGWESC